jgi:hypothetical protein
MLPEDFKAALELSSPVEIWREGGWWESALLSAEGGGYAVAPPADPDGELCIGARVRIIKPDHEYAAVLGTVVGIGQGGWYRTQLDHKGPLKNLREFEVVVVRPGAPGYVKDEEAKPASAAEAAAKAKAAGQAKQEAQSAAARALEAAEEAAAEHAHKDAVFTVIALRGAAPKGAAAVAEAAAARGEAPITVGFGPGLRPGWSWKGGGAMAQPGGLPGRWVGKWVPKVKSKKREEKEKVFDALRLLWPEGSRVEVVQQDEGMEGSWCVEIVSRRGCISARLTSALGEVDWLSLGEVD